MSTLGQRFKELRKERCLRQEDLLDQFNKKYNYKFTKSAISQYENNKRIPEIKALSDFAEFFGVSIDYLLGKSDIRNYDEIQNIIKSNYIPKEEFELNTKDKKEIKTFMKETREKLTNTEGWMFDGEPATPEALESILTAMEMGIALAKQKNKEKYTPNKYKTDKE